MSKIFLKRPNNDHGGKYGPSLQLGCEKTAAVEGRAEFLIVILSKSFSFLFLVIYLSGKKIFFSE